MNDAGLVLVSFFFFFSNRFNADMIIEYTKMLTNSIGGQPCQTLFFLSAIHELFLAKRTGLLLHTKRIDCGLLVFLHLPSRNHRGSANTIGSMSRCP